MTDRILAALAVAVAVTLFPAVASADLDGCGLVVEITSPAPEEMAKAAGLGADAVLFVVDGNGEPAQMEALSAQAAKHGLKAWIGARSTEKAPTPIADGIEGLALLFPSPKGEARKRDERDALLQLKSAGDQLGDSIRQIKKALGPGKKLALCVARSETAPETARGQYVPVSDLVRDGTADVVCLSDAERYNFHRLRLLRDAPLRAGEFVDAQFIEEKSRAGILSRTALAAIANDTCECLWIGSPSLDLVKQAVVDAVAAHKQSETKHKAIEAAIANDELVVVSEVPPGKCNDQAAVHGVGQCFIPSEDGLCPLIQIYGSIRGCKGPLPPPLKVDLRINDRNMPGGAEWGRTEIPAAEFAHEPTYRWGNACFDPPIRLRKGEKYWIYLSNGRHPEGSYLWRLIKDGASKHCNAWSCRYDYSKHTWVYRVFIKKKK